jgi:hypothetical protein
MLENLSLHGKNISNAVVVGGLLMAAEVVLL